jgi:tRNA-2-methylthio-N6-dimethylallyladenosine synthase
MSEKIPKYHITTYGCQMNKSDSERLATILESCGLTATDDLAVADLVIMNSCSVRQSAEDRIFGQLRKLKKLKAERPDMLVAITGCLPGRDIDGQIRAKMPEADLYFPTKEMVQLPRWLAELRPDLFHTGDSVQDYLKVTPKYAPGSQAFISIQTGCNKFCTYCVVPYSRGREANRPAADIIAEARGLVETGVVEVTLLGQAVNAYVAPDPESFAKGNPYQDHFAALLWELNQLAGIARIHWTAAYPTHMTDEVIDALTLPKQVNYLHLPVQAGNDEVLKRMNRRYTAAEFLEIIDKVKAKRPGIALGTDIIVGFCGETAEQFEDTVSLYKAADFDIAYIAQYSVRSGTQAAELFKDDVPRPEKKRRWQVLQQLMEEIVLRKNQAYVGQQLSVLVDEEGDGWCGGNSSEMKRVRFVSDRSRMGELVTVKAYHAMEWLLMGELVSPETPDAE